MTGPKKLPTPELPKRLTKKNILLIIKEKGYSYAREIAVDHIKKNCGHDLIFHNSRRRDIIPPRAKFFIAKDSSGKSVIIHYYRQKGIGKITIPHIEVIITYTYKKVRR